MVRLTTAQNRVIELVASGQKLYWSRSYNSYFIGVPGAEHNSRRVQQITVFEVKLAGLISASFTLTPKGIDYARSKGWLPKEIA